MSFCLAVDLKRKMEAHGLISEFQLANDPIITGTTDPFAFTRTDFHDFVEQLYARVSNPFSINQGGVNLCGPAAVMFCWLCRRPDLYVKYVLTMYEHGRGRMGTLLVRPSADCKNHKPVSISNVDWVALAALRDSENTLFDFDSEPNYFGAITMPDEIEKWFGNIGFSVLESDTNWVWSKGYAALRKASKYLVQGKCVCLLINAKVLSAKGINLFPNHWVVMTTEPAINGQSIVSLPNENGLLDKQVDFNVFTWGANWSVTLNELGQAITLKKFIDCFYGFVVAEQNDSSAFAGKVSFMFDQMKGLAYVNI